MKIRSKFLSMIMLFAMVVCTVGCGDVAETVVPVEEEADNQTQDMEESAPDVELTDVEIIEEEEELNLYCFVSNDVIIQVDADMDLLKVDLEESKSVFEAPSCAGEGVSYLYDFSSFEIETYPAEDGKNRIGYIYLKDDMVSTLEGIDLSMKKDDVILTYGTEYEEFDNQFVYEKEGTKLCFIFEEEQIISIEYRSALIG
ncbi:MAG: hypothetical protein R3Y24_06850 [Eubacteriales bacterium]